MQRLYRSRTDRVIAGVCGGIAAYYGIDPTVVRVLAVLLAWVSSGLAVLAYLVMIVVVPEEPPAWQSSAQAAGGEGTEMAETHGGATPTQPVEGAPTPETQQAPPTYAQPVPPYAPLPPAHMHERGRGGLVAGIVLIVLGVLFLAQEFLGIDFGRLWPLILVAIGVAIILRRR